MDFGKFKTNVLIDTSGYFDIEFGKRKKRQNFNFLESAKPDKPDVTFSNFFGFDFDDLTSHFFSLSNMQCIIPRRKYWTREGTQHVTRLGRFLIKHLQSFIQNGTTL